MVLDFDVSEMAGPVLLGPCCLPTAVSAMAVSMLILFTSRLWIRLQNGTDDQHHVTEVRGDTQKAPDRSGDTANNTAQRIKKESSI